MPEYSIQALKERHQKWTGDNINFVASAPEAGRLRREVLLGGTCPMCEKEWGEHIFRTTPKPEFVCPKS